MVPTLANVRAMRLLTYRCETVFGYRLFDVALTATHRNARSQGGLRSMSVCALALARAHFNGFETLRGGEFFAAFNRCLIRHGVTYFFVAVCVVIVLYEFKESCATSL